MSNTAELATLTLFAATQEQIIESRKRTHPQWSRGLSLDKYLARDASLDVLEHATGGKLITWVLAPRDDPTALDFKCSCETYQRKALVRTPGSEPKEAFGYGIASVYSPLQNRRKGYARHMMRLLHWVLAPRSLLPPFSESWGSPPPLVENCGNASFSALYSDVGAFYHTAGPSETSPGWVIRDPVGTVWDTKMSDASLDKLEGGDVKVQWVTADGAQELWSNDVELMRADMQNSTSNKILFTFLPDAGVTDFLIHRAIHFLEDSLDPEYWGVTVASHAAGGEDGQMPTFATWTLDPVPPPGTLILTRLRATQKTFPHLVAALIRIAREYKMERVEIWNLPKDLLGLAHQYGGRTETRNEHMNSFKWYGPENDADVDWLFNEKFCWC